MKNVKYEVVKRKGFFPAIYFIDEGGSRSHITINESYSRQSGSFEKIADCIAKALNEEQPDKEFNK